MNFDFKSFYDETYLSFKKFLVCKAPKLDLVDDILQDAYVRVYEQSKKKTLEDAKAYLFRVGWNLLKREYKLKGEEPLALLEDIPVSGEVNELDVDLTLEELWNHLSKKDVIVQKCIYLYYLGMSLEEIGEILDLSASAVKNHLYRTFKEIREVF